MSWGSAKSWSSVSESPQWPPPYINARITALAYGQQFEYTLTLWPREDMPELYTGFDPTPYLYVTLILYTTETQNKIFFSEVYKANPPYYFWATDGPTVNVQPPTFNLQNSQWQFRSPADAQITMAIAYPDQP